MEQLPMERPAMSRVSLNSRRNDAKHSLIVQLNSTYVLPFVLAQRCDSAPGIIRQTAGTTCPNDNAVSLNGSSPTCLLAESDCSAVNKLAQDRRKTCSPRSEIQSPGELFQQWAFLGVIYGDSTSAEDLNSEFDGKVV